MKSRLAKEMDVSQYHLDLDESGSLPSPALSKRYMQTYIYASLMLSTYEANPSVTS